MRSKIGGQALGVALAFMGPGTVIAQDDGKDKAALERHGLELVSTNCARCHAIGLTGASTHPQAPPFRTLGSRYPIDALAEGLAEGFSSGHPDMPEFQFEIGDVDAILAYLRSIQDPGQKR